MQQERQPPKKSILSLSPHTMTGVVVFALASFGLFAIATWDTLVIIGPYILYAFSGLSLLAGLIASFTFIAWRVKWLDVKLAELGRDKTLATNAGRQAGIETDRQQMRLMAEGRLMAATISQVRSGLIHAGQLGDGRFSAFPSQIINQVEQGAVPLLEAPERQPIHFEQIARRALRSRGAGRFIAFGGMGSGKTTLAKYVVDYGMEEIAQGRGGQVFVIDPHAPEVVWGDDLKVIGSGMDYESIAEFLDYIVSDVKQRYEAGCGDDSRPLPDPYKPNILICEEWSGVIAELQANKRWTPIHNRTFYMDSRKAGWGFFLVAHEYTVNALGLQGMSNLLNGVEYFITLDKDAVTDQYMATLGKSFRDKNPYELITPGPYRGRMYYSPEQAKSEKAKKEKYLLGAPDKSHVLDLSQMSGPSDDEMAIIEAAKKIKSERGKIVWSAVTGELGWTTGGPNNDRIKAILDKWAIEY